MTTFIARVTFPHKGPRKGRDKIKIAVLTVPSSIYETAVSEARDLVWRRWNDSTDVQLTDMSTEGAFEVIVG